MSQQISKYYKSQITETLENLLTTGINIRNLQLQISMLKCYESHWACWYTSGIEALGPWRQEAQEFKVNSGYLICENLGF